MNAYQLTISAAGSVVGTLVACATYSAIRSTAHGSAFAVTQGSRILAFLLGRSAEYVAGTRIGDVVQVTMETTGRDVVAPALRLGGETTAAATAAVAGAGAAMLTTAAICGGVYVGQKVYERLPAWPQKRNFLQIEEPVRFDVHLQEGDLQVVLPARFTESQILLQDAEPHPL